MLEKKHLPWLDLFRFFAAFEVLASHARGFVFVEYGALIDNQNILVSTFYAITRMGSEAVIIFFVLSGFLVGGKAIERLSNGTFHNLDYIIDRMLRILIPLFPALLLSVICDFVVSKSINVIELFGNIFFLQGMLVKPLSGNAPLWSLSYEFWFYLLIFFVGGMLLSKAKKWVWLIGIVSVFVVFSVLNAAYLFCWVIGAIVYIYRNNEKNNLVFSLASLGIFLILFFIQISLVSKSVDIDFFSDYLPSLNILYILLSMVFGIFLQQTILRIPKNSIVVKINTIGAFLASFSYTLYLTHYPILSLFKSLGFEKYNSITFKSMMVYMGFMAICLLIAFVIYLPFEKRTDYYKKLIKKRYY
ncbi:MAG: peptidoglycan/LPS O-acetylase OafA/YrhL [Psychroserpens sp.]|jgi:peptidoglycan/LPS O-acetylase OafA/YrhL